MAILLITSIWETTPSEAIAVITMLSIPLHVAVVCSSNQHWSMEAHRVLNKWGFNLKSFGIDGFVRCAGPTPDKLNIYDFETLYDKICHDLLKKDRAFYTQNGIVHMQDRNRGIKSGPEQVPAKTSSMWPSPVRSLSMTRWWNAWMPEKRGCVISVSIPDNYEEATLGPSSSASFAIVSSKWEMWMTRLQNCSKCSR